MVVFTPDYLMNLNKSFLHHRYWTPDDHRALKEAGHSLRSMRDVAMSVISRMPSGIHMVSGLGDLQSNFQVFYRTIEHLSETEQLNIFSQMPFEDGMVEYQKRWTESVGGKHYCWPILLEFYKPLFLSRKFDTLHFIHGFESSVGACWEYEQCLKLGIKIRRLSRKFSIDLVEAQLIES